MDGGGPAHVPAFLYNWELKVGIPNEKARGRPGDARGLLFSLAVHMVNCPGAPRDWLKFCCVELIAVTLSFKGGHQQERISVSTNQQFLKGDDINRRTVAGGAPRTGSPVKGGGEEPYCLAARVPAKSREAFSKPCTFPGSLKGVEGMT